MFWILILTTLLGLHVSGVGSRGVPGTSGVFKDVEGTGFKGSACPDCPGHGWPSNSNTDDQKRQLPSTEESLFSTQRAKDIGSDQLKPTDNGVTTRRLLKNGFTRKPVPFLQLSRIRIKVNSKLEQDIAKENHFLSGSVDTTSERHKNLNSGLRVHDERKSSFDGNENKREDSLRQLNSDKTHISHYKYVQELKPNNDHEMLHDGNGFDKPENQHTKEVSTDNDEFVGRTDNVRGKKVEGNIENAIESTKSKKHVHISEEKNDNNNEFATLKPDKNGDQNVKPGARESSHKKLNASQAKETGHGRLNTGDGTASSTGRKNAGKTRSRKKNRNTDSEPIGKVIRDKDHRKESIKELMIQEFNKSRIVDKDKGEALDTKKINLNDEHNPNKETIASESTTTKEMSKKNGVTRSKFSNKKSMKELTNEDAKDISKELLQTNRKLSQNIGVEEKLTVDEQVSSEKPVSKKTTEEDKRYSGETLVGKKTVTKLTIEEDKINERKPQNKKPLSKTSVEKQRETEDNKSDGDRWSRQGIPPVPEVARLEQRLHPQVNGPANGILWALKNILSVFQNILAKVDADYKMMFNMTRYEIMMGVRKELSKIATGNNKAYDAVVEASLLTKQIYFREHQARRIGYISNQIATAAAHGLSADILVPDIDLVQYKTAVEQELRQATRLKQKIERMASVRDGVVSEMMRLHLHIAQHLSARPLMDLTRHAHQVIDMLESPAFLLDMKNDGFLLSHMNNDTTLGMLQAHKQLQYADNFLQQGRQNLAKNRKLRHEILTLDVRAPVPVSRPYNAQRVEEWAMTDMALSHARKLIMQTLELHKTIHPSITAAKLFLDHPTIERDKHSHVGRLAGNIQQDIQVLKSVMGQIHDLLGYTAPVLSRRPCLQTQGSGSGDVTDDQEQDCEDEEGSGQEQTTPSTTLIEDTEGSGEIDIDDVTNGLNMSNIPIESVVDKTDNATSSKELIFIDEDELDTFESSGENPDDLTTTTPSHTTTKPPNKVTERPSTTTQSTTAKSDFGFGFADIFGFLDDQSSDDLIADGTGSETLDLTQDLTLNELLLKKLSNLSQSSLPLQESAHEVMKHSKELSETHGKLKQRLEEVASRTKDGRTAVQKTLALLAELRALHERHNGIAKDIEWKAPLMMEQVSRAVDVATKKVNNMEEALKTRKGGRTEAPDQKVVQELREAVSTFKENMKEISHLRHLSPDPCRTVQIFDLQFRSNISDLRRRVEQAKLIAASLPISVSMKDKGHLALPVPAPLSQDMSIFTNIGAVFKPTMNDGPVITVKTKNTGSVMFSVRSQKAAVAVLDKNDKQVAVQGGNTSLVPGTWYKVVIQRVSNSFNASIFNATLGTLVDLVTLRPTSKVPSSQLFPTEVYVAGVTSQFPKYDSREWNGCVGDVTINGERLNLLTKDNTDKLPNLCSSIRHISQLSDSWIFDGTGYVHFPLDRILNPGSRVQTVSITFIARSDGVLLNLQLPHALTRLTMQVSKGRVEVVLHLANSRTGHITQSDVIGREQTIQVQLDTRRPVVKLNGGTDGLETIPSLNDDSNASQLHGLYVGGTSEMERSFQGCVHSLLINDRQIGFESQIHGSGVRQGYCQQQTCYKFNSSSQPLDMKEVNGSTLILTFIKDSSGTLMELARGTKFAFSLTLDKDTLNLKETVKDKSDRIDLKKYKPHDKVTVTVKDNAEDEKLLVSVGDVEESLNYGGGGWFWNAGPSEPGPSTYNVTLGGSTRLADGGKGAGFTGSFTDVVIEYRQLDLSIFVDTNYLHQCDSSIYATVQPPTVSPITEIELRPVCKQ